MKYLVYPVSFLVFLLLFVFDSDAQISEKLLVGSWEEVSRSSVGEDDENAENILIIPGISSNENTKRRITLLSNGRGVDHQSDFEFFYYLDNDILILGKRRFNVKELTETRMILVDHVDLQKQPLKTQERVTFRRIIL